MDSSASQSSLTKSNQEFCHILFHKEFVFCLVCQRDIDRATDASQHILEHEHKENLKNLFKICIKDPFCESTDPRYADIVNNSVLDTSHILSNETSYIYQMDKNFICLLCQKTVSSANGPDEIKRDLVFHLNVEREIHLDYIKCNFSWFYCQTKTKTLIMFHNSVVYCSLCDQILNYDDNLMLNAAAGHLQTSQHRTKLESILLPNNVTEKPNPIATDESQSIDGLDQELESLEVTDNAILHFGDNQSDISGNNSEESDFEGLDKILKEDSLTCPQCGETIEIYNDNADFSLRHHSQKHIDLSIVNKGLECEYEEDTDYVCPVCTETIPIFNKNLELSIARHFDESDHDKGFCTSELRNESEFLDKVLSKLPQEHQVHRDFFKLDGNRIFCKLCNSVLQDSNNNVSFASESLTKHISGHYHSDQYKTSSQQLTLAVVSYSKETVTGAESLSLQNDMFERLANKNIHIRNNKDFIEVQKYLYLCKICQKYICYSPNESTLKSNFLFHFNLLCHKNNLKAREAQNSQPTVGVRGEEKQPAKQSVIDNGVFQNVLCKMAKDPLLSDVKYIEYKSGKFICHICNVTMSASNCGSPVKQHILGLKHEKQKRLGRVKNERAQHLLNKTVKFSFNHLINANLNHIDIVSGNFFCNLCKVSIIATRNLLQLKEHLASNSHYN